MFINTLTGSAMRYIVLSPQGGSHIDMVYVNVSAFWTLFCKFWYSNRGFFISDEDAQFTQIGCI